MAQVQGFGEENTSELEGMSLYVGINYQSISITMTILSCLGAIIEASVSVSAGIWTLMDKKIDNRIHIGAYGRQVGSQMIGTAFNTLFFGFFGGSLALFIWFVKLNYSLGQFINNKIFAAEVLVTMLSAIGVILVIPVTIKVFKFVARKKSSGQ